MEEFLQQNFGYLIHTEGTIFVVLSIFMFSFKVPKTKDYAPYRVTKNLLAASFLVTAVNVFLWIFLVDDDWHDSTQRIACMDIIFYYLLGVTFSFAITNLLDRKCITRSRCTTTAITWAITSAVSLLSLVDGLREYQNWFLGAGLLGLLEFCVRALLYFRKKYNRSGEILANYFSEDKLHFISWIKRSFYLLYGAALIAIVTINTGIFANWALIVYIICSMVYVATSFVNYSFEYGYLSKADTEDVTNYYEATEKAEKEEKKEEEKHHKKTKESRKEHQQQILTDNVSARLEQKLKEWVKDKRYRTEQFSIDELASRVGTNKYYLSTYIRKRYDMNFSSWVASLRIQEAKRMMLENRDIRLENVAYAVGFSSLSYFSKVFSKQEGASPSAWLNNQAIQSA